MKVKRLGAIVYTDGGNAWHTETTMHPKWPAIEEAARRLDKHCYPFLFLCLNEAEDDDERLEIIGGGGDYWLAGNVDGHWQRRLQNPDGGSERVRVWTSDQGFSDEERHICHDLHRVLRAARYFFEHGGFDPSLDWEPAVGGDVDRRY